MINDDLIACETALDGIERSIASRDAEIARLRAEVERLTQAVGLATTCAPRMVIDLADPVGMMQEVCRQFAARDKVIEAAFRALDDAVAGIRYVEQKEHFYGLGADRVEEKYAEARRLRAELEGKK